MGSDTPFINFQTSERLDPDDVTMIPEIKQHSFYMMQLLQVGSSQVLTFFDPGANTHCVKGDII